MLIMCEEFTFIVHTPSQEQCRQQQLVEKSTGCLENRRPRRIRRQQQKQLQWLSAAGAEDACLLCCQIGSLRCTMQIVSTRVESPGSSHPWQDAAWQLGILARRCYQLAEQLKHLIYLVCDAKRAINKPLEGRSLLVSLSPSPPSLCLSLSSVMRAAFKADGDRTCQTDSVDTSWRYEPSPDRHKRCNVK